MRRVHSREGQAYCTISIYLDRRVEGHIEAAVAATTARAHDEHDGDILVFLPGIGEIRRTESLLADDADFAVTVLRHR